MSHEPQKGTTMEPMISAPFQCKDPFEAGFLGFRKGHFRVSGLRSFKVLGGLAFRVLGV